MTRVWTTYGVRNWESMDASAFYQDQSYGHRLRARLMSELAVSSIAYEVGFT